MTEEQNFALVIGEGSPRIAFMFLFYFEIERIFQWIFIGIPISDLKEKMAPFFYIFLDTLLNTSIFNFVV